MRLEHAHRGARLPEVVDAHVPTSRSHDDGGAILLDVDACQGILVIEHLYDPAQQKKHWKQAQNTDINLVILTSTS